MKAGIATAARMPMIATTIINSMRVNPFWIFFILSIATPWRDRLGASAAPSEVEQIGSTRSQKCLLPHAIRSRELSLDRAEARAERHSAPSSSSALSLPFLDLAPTLLQHRKDWFVS